MGEWGEGEEMRDNGRNDDLIDSDSSLTEGDYISLQKYRAEKEKGLLISESDARRGLGL